MQALSPPFDIEAAGQNAIMRHAPRHAIEHRGAHGVDERMGFRDVAPRRFIGFDDRAEIEAGRLAQRQQLFTRGKGMRQCEIGPRRIGPLARYGPAADREIGFAIVRPIPIGRGEPHRIGVTRQKLALAEQQMARFNKSDVHPARQHQPVGMADIGNKARNRVGAYALRTVPGQPQQNRGVGRVAMSCQRQRAIKLTHHLPHIRSL